MCAVKDANLMGLQDVCPRVECQCLKLDLVCANLTCCVFARLVTLADAESGLLSVLAASGLTPVVDLLA